MLTNSIINDPRLSPLLDDCSVLVFQLYILEIEDRRTSNKNYDIIYGWCLKSTRKDIEAKIFSSDIKKIHSSQEAKYSIVKLSFYNNSDNVINLVNELLSGKNMKASCDKLKIDHSRMLFDFNLNPQTRKIRPIIFNESNSSVTRNFIHLNSLRSPYKSVPSFSLIVSHLNKLEPFIINEKELYPSWQKGLIEALLFLEDETNLSFTTSESIRFGNIEFINTQCSNEYELHNVFIENIKETIKIDNHEITTSKEVKITLKPNSHIKDRELLINCYITNADQITTDNCKIIRIDNTENEVEVSFNSDEPISHYAISIWRKENNLFEIWYKNAHTLIREMHTNIGIVGTSGIVKSEWLNKIKADAGRNSKIDVERAEKINRVSYSKSIIGKYSIDPWVKSEKEFSTLINNLTPKQSEAQFFPKGWSFQDEEHGALSFLYWFKKITNHAEKLIIVDPFYDTLGLEFLARTSNTSTEFSIITCTQIASRDDDYKTKNWFIKKFQKKKKKDTVPNRAKRIINFINAFPSLFQTIKLNIYDIRSSGGGDKNLLHDRYILVFESNQLSRGFHLSNSIQGATKFHPILITPIPRDVLLKVDEYLSSIVGNDQNNNVIELYNSDSVVKIKNSRIKKHLFDEELSNQLKKVITKEDEIELQLFQYLLKMQNSNQNTFFKYWASLSHFMANSKFAHTILNSLVDNFPKKSIELIRLYLECTLSNSKKAGYEYSDQHARMDFSFLFQGNFKGNIEDCLRLENHFFESISFSHWGSYFGCKLLLRKDISEFVKLIDFLEIEIKKKSNEDLSQTPVLKLTNLAFGYLAKQLFYHEDVGMIRSLIQSNQKSIRPLAAAAIISKLSKQKLGFSEAQTLIVNFTTEEKLILYTNCLSNFEFNKVEDEKTTYDIYNSILDILTTDFSQSHFDFVFSNLIESNIELVEKTITEKLLLKLIENEVMTMELAVDLWFNEFFKLLDSKRKNNFGGAIDLAGWAFKHGTVLQQKQFLKKIKKELRNLKSKIWKPLSKGTQEWKMSFEGLLIIRTVAIIAILYNERDISSECYYDLNQIIKEINEMTDSYQPHEFLDGYINAFSRLLLNEYNEN